MYRNIKNLLGDDGSDNKIEVENIKDYSDEEQCELIADKFAEVSNLYEPLKRDKIVFPSFSRKDLPVFTEVNVIEAIKALDSSKSTQKLDIPAKVLKYFSGKISKPLTKIINNCIQQGVWPSIYKSEIVTPVPKVPNPQSIDDLRNISGLMNLNKVLEKLICPLIVNDMKSSLDKTQFANQAGLSTQHYLIKIIDRILSVTDKSAKGECVAVLATLLDWSKAFPMQDHTLGVKSFIRNGVRPALIPLVASFFEDRSMRVAWRGKLSSKRLLPGSGPQGSSWGILEYLSQSNNSADNVPEADRAKFMDDLTIMEIIFLANVGLASYNIKSHINSNLPIHNQIIPSDHLKTQDYVKVIDNWTNDNMMKLNERKTKNMIFNFTKDKQFITNINLKNHSLEIVNETKLLGAIVTNNLKWEENTKHIVKKANRRMIMLHKLVKFTRNKSHLLHIYKTNIRNHLEYCSTVWHSSLTETNSKDIERVQKSAMKTILGAKYQGYEKALIDLKIDSLKERREKMALKFAKKSLKDEKFSTFFQENKNNFEMKTRNSNKYVVNHANTERYRKSAVPFLQRLLNEDYIKQKKNLKKMLQVNNGIQFNTPIT